jgi:TatD DNase family protein
LIDTHCHIDVYDNPVAVLEQAVDANVKVVAVTEDPGRYRMLRTKLGRRDGVEVALGFHPLRAGGLGPHHLARFLRLLPQTTWVGEIGLDFSRAGHPTKSAQLRAFEAILAEPRLRTLPVTVHSRGAEREAVRRLAQARVSAVLHWYTGSLDVAEEALGAGMYFSINPAMIRSRRASELLQALPLERVLLETDGPYAKHGARDAVPADIVALLRTFARMRAIPEGQLRQAILNNQQELLSRMSAAPGST